MQKEEQEKYKLPNSPGVYFFKKGKEILYIGKATSLKDRVQSYFSNDLISTRGSRMVDMVSLANNISFEKTDSVLEALILEANLIKRYEPKYNIKEKDNKSYNFVAITKEDLPRVVLERGRSLDFSDVKYSKIYGPFPSQSKLLEALKIIRKIFPFKAGKSNSKIYSQMGLEPEDKDVKRNIRNIKIFFSGKKRVLIKKLESEMYKKTKELKFEEAGEIKRQIYALNHINDVALITESAKSDKGQGKSSPRDGEVILRGFRIEAYDIAHMNGQNSVGVMTVMENGVVKKSEYKKFILRETKRGDDVGGLREILTRRMKHSEWEMPGLVVIDGGKNQINEAKRILGSLSKIKIVSVLKDDKHKPKDILGDQTSAKKYKKEIFLINNEAHRFAITFFRSKQRKNLIIR